MHQNTWKKANCLLGSSPGDKNNKKSSTPDSHCCAEILQELPPAFRCSLCAVPRKAGSQRHGGGSGPQALDIWYVYMR